MIAVSLIVAPAAQAAAQVMVLNDPITDNYKASYNDDPTRVELRTWLAMRAITVDAATWRPALPRVISFSSVGSIALVSSDGRVGTLTVELASGPMASLPQVRFDPLDAPSAGRWGPFGAIVSRDLLAAAPAVFELSLTAEGRVVGVGTLSYRHDRLLADAPGGDIEHNGPGGRWYVGPTATRTLEEPAPIARPSVAAGTDTVDAVPPVTSAGGAQVAAQPTIVRVQLPARTRTRTVVMSVRALAAGSRISTIRVRFDGHGWGRWTRIAPRQRLILPRSAGLRRVLIQVRDESGVASPIVSRRIHCVY